MKVKRFINLIALGKSEEKMQFKLPIFMILLFSIACVSAVGNTVPIQIQVTDGSGDIETGTYEFTINISNSSSCSPVLYSNISTKTTDNRGIVAYDLAVDLDFSEQYYLCYYRDGVSKENKTVGTNPYSFRSNTTNYALGTLCTGIEYLAGNGSCLTASGSGDITAVNTAGKYLIGGSDNGDVSLLINESELNATITALASALGADNSSWNQTLADTLYADISVTGDNSSWNETYADTKYTTGTEADLNVNSSDYWDTYNTANTTWFSNVLGVLTIDLSQLTSYINTWLTSKTTDDLTQGTTNLYDNSSWNETHADTLYADISVAGDNSSFNQSLTDTLYVNIDGDTMTGNIEFSGNNISNITSLQFDDASAMTWNSEKHTLNIPTGLGNTIQDGQELTLPRINKAGVSIYAGQLVYTTGSEGENITVDLADASNNSKIEAVGMVTIPECLPDALCPITYFGEVHDLNTSAFAEGTHLYLAWDGSGDYTDTLPTGNNYSIHIGFVSKSDPTDGIIDFHEHIDWGDTPLINSLRIKDELYILDADVSTIPTIIKQIEPNDQIDGSVLGFYVENPPNPSLPHLYIQSGGNGQFSGMVRTWGIINEDEGFLNNSNRTDCITYFDYIGEELKIDCNTTTTGADFFVSDDMQIVGEVWIKDTEDEWHFMTREMELLDEMRDQTVLVSLNNSLVGTNFTVVERDGKSIIVNDNKVNYDLGTGAQSVTITAGTNTTPQYNHIYYTDGGAPVLTANTAEVADVSSVMQGVFGSNGYDYASFAGSAAQYEFTKNVYERFWDTGAIYTSGFDIAASTTKINFTSGTMKIILSSESIDAKDTSTGYITINSDGTFEQATSLNNLNLYADGGTIGSQKFYNVVFGVAHTIDGEGQLYAVVQNEPLTEYISTSAAEVDSDNALNFFPSNDLVAKVYTPLARGVIKNTAGVMTLQTLSNGELFIDIRGQVTSTSGGSSPSPGITVHSDLTNLDYASAGHTGFAPAGYGDDWNKTYADTLYLPHTTIWDAVFNNTLTNFLTTWLSGKTTDDLTEGTTNLYDNSSWNETHADTLYADISVVDTDTNLTEDDVEAYIFDNDNAANLNMSGQNITTIDCITFDSGGSICSGV